jgi:hypothetical protein
MSFLNIGLILLFAILWLLVLFVIVRSTYINNRIFNCSTSFLKSDKDIPYAQGQRYTFLWIIRIFSFILMIYVYFIPVFSFNRYSLVILELK